jgi:hypothetical protein
MQWVKRVRPSIGDKKVVRKFLWLPLSRGWFTGFPAAPVVTTRWLEFAVVEYRYLYHRGRARWVAFHCWSDEEWNLYRETWNK